MLGVVVILLSSLRRIVNWCPGKTNLIAIEALQKKYYSKISHIDWRRDKVIVMVMPRGNLSGKAT